MNTLWFDLRYTVRLISRSPGFAALCVLVIALALGLALTIYVLVSNQGLKPIPIPNGERYVALQLIDKKSNRTLKGDRFNAHIVQTLQGRSSSYEYLGASRIHGFVTISDGEITESPFGVEIAPRLMQLTSVVPLMGRNLVEGDALPGAEPVALIGHKLWQNYYGGREDIIGHRSRIDARMHTIVGVLPKNFSYPLDHHLWKPLQLPANSLPTEHNFHLTPIGILKPGITIDDANLELAAIMDQLAEEFPDEYGRFSADVVPFVHAASAMDFSTTNTIMIGAGFIILLLACLNVGNLLLVRANERTQELVIRSALGGTRWRIIQQVLLESLLICLAGGALGLWLGFYGAKFVKYQTEVVVGSSYLPFWMSFDIGSDIVLLAIAITLIVWIFAGGVPAWLASQLQINTALNGGGKGVAGKGNSKIAKILVAAEVTCSFFLLVLSGAFVTSVHLANQIDYGVPTENFVTSIISLKGTNYEDDVARYQYLRNLEEELLSQPGIVSVSYTTALPGMGRWQAPYAIEDRDLKAGGNYPRQMPIFVDDDFFQSVGVPLLDGRHFSETDMQGSLGVAIVEQAFVEKMWPGQSALGKRIHINPEGDNGGYLQQWVTIVGVISHIDQGQANGWAKGITSLYMPMSQTAPSWAHMLVQYAEQPRNFQTTIKKAATRVDRDISLRVIRSLEESLFLNTKMLKALSELFVGVAMIALVLAGTGIYGVVSRTVLLRTHEMGIRRALGFTDRGTIRLFLRQGVFYLIVGAALGGGGALITSNLLAAEFPTLLNSIFSITIFITLTMTGLVLGACYIPARKIVSLEPSAALHYE